jgi:hypothetical protein
MDTSITIEGHTIRAIWDAEAGVFYSESDIVGLHIEEQDIADFMITACVVAPELLITQQKTRPR